MDDKMEKSAQAPQNIARALEFLKTGRAAEIVLKGGDWKFAKAQGTAASTLLARLGGAYDDDGSLNVRAVELLRGAIRMCENSPGVYNVDEETLDNGDTIYTLSAVAPETPAQ